MIYLIRARGNPNKNLENTNKIRTHLGEEVCNTAKASCIQRNAERDTFWQLCETQSDESGRV